MGDVRDICKITKPVILIVEDHDALRESLQKWLGAVFQDSSVLQSKSAEEALAKVLEMQPDVVLMDIMLPGMSGIDATRLIRDAVPKAQVVMLSIYEDSAYRAGAAVAGANAYIPKRKMGTELIPVLTKLLNADPYYS
jgi:NarL family two-component system response regulator LiaR